jgi:hypothetical protein
VLWTSEENSGAGGRAYRDAVGADVRSHVAAIEMDGGCERPTGFGFTVLKPGEPRRREGAPRPAEPDDPAAAQALASLRAVGALFAPLDATAVKWGGGGADIAPLMREGVPGLSLDTVGEHYFDWHHTHADTLDKVEPADLKRATAMLALMGWALADAPDRLVPQDAAGIRIPVEPPQGGDRHDRGPQ